MGVEVLDVMRGPDRVERSVREMGMEIHHRADDVGLRLRIDIEAHLLPGGRRETRVQGARAFRPAPGIEQQLRRRWPWRVRQAHQSPTGTGRAMGRTG